MEFTNKELLMNSSRLELYAELNRGLKDIQKNRTTPIEVVRAEFEQRWKERGILFDKR